MSAVVNVLRSLGKLRMVARACNSNTWEVETTWAAYWVPGQPGRHSKSLSLNKETKQNKKKQQKAVWEDLTKKGKEKGKGKGKGKGKENNMDD